MADDWAMREADELLYLLALVSDERGRREILAAKLRDVDAAGAMRGVQMQIAERRVCLEAL